MWLCRLISKVDRTEKRLQSCISYLDTGCRRLQRVNVIILYYLNTKIYSKNEISMPSPAGLDEFLPFCFTKRVNSPKHCLIRSFHKRGVYQIKRKKISLKSQRNSLSLQPSYLIVLHRKTLK